MEYSPNCAIPYVVARRRRHDRARAAGRRRGRVVGRSRPALRGGLGRRRRSRRIAQASEKLYRVKDRAFEAIARRLRDGVADDRIRHSAADGRLVPRRRARQRFGAERVGGGERRQPALPADGDGASRAIRPDELVLLDLWGKLDRPGAVFADITWMGFTGRACPTGTPRRSPRSRGARDAAVALVQHAVARGPGAARLARSIAPRRRCCGAPATATRSCIAPATASARRCTATASTWTTTKRTTTGGCCPAPALRSNRASTSTISASGTEINMIVGAARRGGHRSAADGDRLALRRTEESMSTRKTTLFYVAADRGRLAGRRHGDRVAARSDAGLVGADASRVPPMNSAPLTGPVDAQTFRNIAKAQSPTVVNIRTEMKAQAQDLTDFFGGGGGADDLLPPLLRRRRRPATTAGRSAAAAAAAGGRSASRRRRPPAPASSSARTASSSPTTTSSKTRPRSRSRSTATTTTSATRPRSIGRDPLTDSALIQLIEKPNRPAAGSEVRRLVADGSRATG